MPRIFVSSVIAQLVDLMNRNFVTGLRNLAEKLSG
jgi:hypothetical protein